MLFHSPGAEIISIGPLTLRWYGLLIALGFYLSLQYATLLIRQRAHKHFNDLEDFQNTAYILLFAGIFGARTWYVVLDWQYFSYNLLEIPQIWHGGISIQGGIMGAFAAAFLIFAKEKEKILFYLSALVSALPLAQAIGRWGNFFNEEAFGAVCDLPWKLYISHTGQYHHPTFLYESILNLMIFAILFLSNKYFYENSSKKDLCLIGIYLFLYSFVRFFLEAIRSDSLLIGGFAAAQLLAIIGMSVGALMTIINASNKN